MTAVEKWVNGKDPDFFSSGLMALEHRCIKRAVKYITDIIRGGIKKLWA